MTTHAVRSENVEIDGRTYPVEVKIDDEKAVKWLNNGAQPTDTVRDLFKKYGVIEKFEQSKKA